MEVVTLTNPPSDQQLYMLFIWCKPNTYKNNFKLYDKTGKSTAPNLDAQIEITQIKLLSILKIYEYNYTHLYDCNITIKCHHQHTF
jgi:hypothetical protein